MVVQAKLETQWKDVSTTFSEADLRQVDPDLASLPLLIPAFKKVWSYNSPEWVQQLTEVFAKKKKKNKSAAAAAMNADNVASLKGLPARQGRLRPHLIRQQRNLQRPVRRLARQMRLQRFVPSQERPLWRRLGKHWRQLVLFR